MKFSTWLVGAVALVSQKLAGQSCQNLVIPVSLSALTVSLVAQKMYIPLDFDITDKNALADLLLKPVFNQTLRGTYSIAAVYCPPTGNTNAQRSKTLQLLIHGIASSKEYWSGLGTPGNGYQGNNYSWIATATAAGYPILAIDRLGNGKSSHPDPILVSQLPANIEVVHQIITTARAGKLPGISTAFSKVIVVGNSFGSLTTNGLTARYPKDADAAILTGVSRQLALSIPGVFLTAGLLPAVVFNSQRYANLALGYVAGSNSFGINFLNFYAGSYDPPLAKRTMDTTGTFSVGEGVTAALSPVSAPNYAGPVYVIDGKQSTPTYLFGNLPFVASNFPMQL